jgi:hypothetical protein
VTGENVGFRRHERLAIDEQLDDGSVRAVQDALADARETVGGLAIGNRAEFIEAVEKHARLPHGPAFLRHSVNAEIAV